MCTYNGYITYLTIRVVKLYYIELFLLCKHVNYLFINIYVHSYCMTYVVRGIYCSHSEYGKYIYTYVRIRASVLLWRKTRGQNVQFSIFEVLLMLIKYIRTSNILVLCTYVPLILELHQLQIKIHFHSN